APYADVAEGAWFASTVSAAKAYGALDENLTADGNFYPDQPITREEMTSVIVRLAEEIRGALLNKKNGFTDASVFAPWTAEYIAKAAGEGIVTGNPDGSFNAKGNATRAEAAVIIKRFRDLLNKAPRKLEAGEYHPVYDAPIFEVDLQKMIDEAYAKGEKSITLEKGAYRLKPQGKGGHLRFADMKDFTVYGNGSTLLFQSPGAVGVLFENSENIWLKNLQTDCEKLSFYQARITAIDPKEYAIDIVVPNGFRDYFDDRAGFSDEIYIQFHDGVTGDYIHPAGSSTMTFSKLEKLGNRKYRLHSASISKAKGLKVGDYLAGGERTVTGTSVVMSYSKQCGLEDYTIWSGKVGLGLTHGYGDHRFHNVRLEPGPRPLGAIEDRIFSTIADAAHVNYMEVGPKIYDSIFRNCGDDGFNNYGAFNRVAERKSDTEVILGKNNNSKIEVGNQLYIYTPGGTELGCGVVKSIEELENYTPKVDLSAATNAASFNPGSYVRIKLDTAIKNVTSGCWVTNASKNCSDFEIKNTYYANIRSRGILIKGSNGVIEGCTVYNCGSPGILLAPEFNWMEADYVRNVTVRGNTVIDCGQRGNYASIYVYGKEGWNNKNIVIEDNTIIGSYETGIRATHVTGLVIRNNVIESRFEGSTKVVPVIDVDQVENGEIYGNKTPADWTEIRVGEETKNVVLK
ncbi:MAG: S-layer homology domain-containing protein, partial [Clostridia bacterium]|nr:S-layer homology domain-containing protein [Clostridia bacterium]